MLYIFLKRNGIFYFNNTSINTRVRLLYIKILIYYMKGCVLVLVWECKVLDLDFLDKLDVIRFIYLLFFFIVELIFVLCLINFIGFDIFIGL